jgi:hypothetical protein
MIFGKWRIYWDSSPFLLVVVVEDAAGGGHAFGEEVLAGVMSVYSSGRSRVGNFWRL